MAAAVAQVSTVRQGGGTWTIRVVSTGVATASIWRQGLREGSEPRERFTITAMYLPDGARRASRVIRRENQTQEQVDTFSPAVDFNTVVETADHRNARAIREARERKS